MRVNEFEINLGPEDTVDDVREQAEPLPRRTGPRPVMSVERGHYDEVVRLAPKDVEIDVDAFGPQVEAS